MNTAPRLQPSGAIPAIRLRRLPASAKALLAAWIALFGLSQAANADPVYTLSNGNSGLSGYSSPFGTATVHLVDSTHATITFTADESHANAYLFGDGGTVGANISGNFLLGTVTGSNTFAKTGTTFSPGKLSDGGAGNEDGFGSFSQTINTQGGYQ